MPLSESFWAKYFKVYDKLTFLFPYQDLLSKFMYYANLKLNASVLDLGSGTGNLSIQFRLVGAEVTSIDFSQEGTNLHKLKDKSANIILSDITKKLPFSHDSFDLVCANNVLYTIPVKLRGKLISEIRRVLKTGGRLILSDLSTEFKPRRVYLGHIMESLRKKGLILTILDVFRLLVPTIKIFYYNYLISKENRTGNYSFIDMGEHEKNLRDFGFKIIDKDIKVYSNQALMIVAEK